MVSIQGRIQDFKRVSAPRGGSRISGWGEGEGGAEGPERGAVSTKRRSAKGSGVLGGVP